MAKKKKFSLLQKAQLLREFGFDVAYGKRGKLSKQHKGRVTRNWSKVLKYVENEKQHFVWQKAPSAMRYAMRKGLNPQQFTPDGFFIRKPKGAKRNPRYSIDKKGVIHYRAEGRKGGKVWEEIHPIDPDLLLEDPPKAILELSRVAAKDRIVLTVNGFDSSSTLEYDLGALANYIAIDLLPKFLDPNLDEDYGNAHGKRLKNGKFAKRTIEDFVDTFHIKITRHGDANKNKKAKRTSKAKTSKRSKVSRKTKRGKR